MVNIIEAQILIEKDVEAALAHDGFHPNSIYDHSIYDHCDLVCASALGFH